MNVDQINPDFLEALSSALCSAECSNDPGEAEQLHKLLAGASSMLSHMRDGKRDRISGRIYRAACHETIANELLDKLPEAAQW